MELLNQVYYYVEEFLIGLTNWGILAFELVGILILLWTGINGVRNYITKNPKIRISLAEGMALALEFKLGSEILRTVLAEDFDELLLIAGIIALRVALTLVLYWEIGHAEKEVSKKKGEVPENSEKSSFEKVLNGRFGKTEERIKEKVAEKDRKEQKLSEEGNSTEIN